MRPRILSTWSDGTSFPVDEVKLCCVFVYWTVPMALKSIFGKHRIGICQGCYVTVAMVWRSFIPPVGSIVVGALRVLEIYDSWTLSRQGK